MFKIIETHCHLDYLKAQSLDDILQQSTQAGVEKIITISVQPSNLDIPFDLSKKYSQIYCSQGIHPHHASEYTQDVEKIICERIKDKSKIIAIGEIGLDYYYEHSQRSVQKKVFETQLQIASDNDLPVIIHSRDADQDTMDILKNFTPYLKRRGVIHSFTSTLELAQFALKENFYLGFNGIITFKKAQNVQDVVKITPIEKILFETDAPFLTPVPHRGKENAPYYLPHIIEKIAELKNYEINELAKVVYQNSHDLFKLV